MVDYLITGYTHTGVLHCNYSSSPYDFCLVWYKNTRRNMTSDIKPCLPRRHSVSSMLAEEHHLWRTTEVSTQGAFEQYWAAGHCCFESFRAQHTITVDLSQSLTETFGFHIFLFLCGTEEVLLVCKHLPAVYTHTKKTSNKSVICTSMWPLSARVNMESPPVNQAAGTCCQTLSGSWCYHCLKACHAEVLQLPHISPTPTWHSGSQWGVRAPETLFEPVSEEIMNSSIMLTVFSETCTSLENLYT